MTFDELPDGERVFIDANIFLYHFGGFSDQCDAFLQRCEDRRIEGFTSHTVMTEILHRLMIAEAIDKGFITPKNPVKKLKARPEIVKKLHGYYEHAQQIRSMGVHVLSIQKDLIEEQSYKIRREYGLLTHDSIILTTMFEHGISHLATNDLDFERVKAIRVVRPTDVSLG